MAKWEQLIKAREQLHLSQLEAAERVKVGLTTYQRWEAGRAKPQPHHRRQLDHAFGRLLEERSADLNGALFAQQEPPSLPLTNSSTHHSEALDEPLAFIATNMTTHLWSLAFKQYPTCEEKRASIRQAIKDFDNMNKTNQSYQITRRDALCSLATLPMITLGLNSSTSTLPPNRYGDMLARCTASLEACWELYQQSDAEGPRLALKCVSSYLPVLKTIAQDKSSYRKEALDLATRYALLKTLLGWISVGPVETMAYAKEAYILSKETGDISLQLSAYSKLAWAYLYNKKYDIALQMAQEAEMHMQRYYRLPNAQPLHACVQSGIYCSLAVMQAKNGKSPYLALGKATETHSGDERFALMTSKYSTLLLESGRAYSDYGDQTKAMEVLTQRIDPETLVSKTKQSEQGYVETLNFMALSSLRTKDRDMEKTLFFWIAGIEGAKLLKNEQRYNEALATYDFMDVVWPGEKRISDLRGYIVHWSEGPSLND